MWLFVKKDTNTYYSNSVLPCQFELEFVYLHAKLSCIYFFWKLPFVVKYAPFHQNLKTFNTLLQLLHGHCKIKHVNIVISLFTEE